MNAGSGRGERECGESGCRERAGTCWAARGRVSQVTAAPRISGQTLVTSPSPGTSAGERSRASPGAGVGARAGCAVRDPRRGKENFLHFGVKRDKPRFARRGGHIKSRASCEGAGLSPKAPATASISFISPPAIYFTFCLLV